MNDSSETPVFPSDPVWTGRGTSGLIAVLSSALPQGTGVLVPANLCAIAVAGIVWAGMRPVFHDVSAEHGNTELAHLQAAHTDGCGAVLAVHNFGRPLEMEAIAGWCEENRLMLIEDVCNALGATHKGRPLGHFGDAALYSLNHGKIVDTGFGGAIAVRNDAQRNAVAAMMAGMPVLDQPIGEAGKVMETALRLARNNGDEASQAQIYEAYRPYAAYRLAPGQQVEIENGLGRLGANIDHRRALAAVYRNAIVTDGVQHVPVMEGEVPWRYNLLVPAQARDALLSHLRGHGVPASAWYPTVNTIFSDMPDDVFPGAVSFAGQVINLWVDLSTETSDAEQTSALIVNFFKDRIS